MDNYEKNKRKGELTEIKEGTKGESDTTTGVRTKQTNEQKKELPPN